MYIITIIKEHGHLVSIPLQVKIQISNNSIWEPHSNTALGRGPGIRMETPSRVPHEMDLYQTIHILLVCYIITIVMRLTRFGTDSTLQKSVGINGLNRRLLSTQSYLQAFPAY